MRYYSKSFKAKITKARTTTLSKELGFSSSIELSKAMRKHKQTQRCIKKLGQTIDWKNVVIDEAKKYIALPLMTVIKTKPLDMIVRCRSIEELNRFEVAFVTLAPESVREDINLFFLQKQQQPREI